MNQYRIWDVDANGYWEAPGSGKTYWTTPGEAMNAWNFARYYGDNKMWHEYSDTDRGYILHKFKLQRVAT